MSTIAIWELVNGNFRSLRNGEILPTFCQYEGWCMIFRHFVKNRAFQSEGWCPILRHFVKKQRRRTRTGMVIKCISSKPIPPLSVAVDSYSVAVDSYSVTVDSGSMNICHIICPQGGHDQVGVPQVHLLGRREGLKD